MSHTLTATAEPGQIRLTWSSHSFGSSTDTGEHRVYHCIGSSGDFSQIAVRGQDNRNYLDTNVTPGTTYLAPGRTSPRSQPSCQYPQCRDPFQHLA